MHEGRGLLHRPNLGKFHDSQVASISLLSFPAFPPLASPVCEIAEAEADVASTTDPRRSAMLVV